MNLDDDVPPTKTKKEPNRMFAQVGYVCLTQRELASLATDRILDDLSDRRGLKWRWQECSQPGANYFAWAAWELNNKEDNEP